MPGATVRRLRRWAWFGLAGATLAVLADAMADPVADAREQIAAERRAIDARAAERVAECQHRFAVTGCVERARAEQRAALAPLRERELALDAQARRARADARRSAIAARRAAAASAAAASAPAPLAPREPAAALLGRPVHGGFRRA